LAPIVKGRKGEYKQVFEDLRRAGYVRARVDGEVRDLGEEIELDKYKMHTIEAVVDRIVIHHGGQSEGATGTNGAGGVGASTSRLKLVAEARAAYGAQKRAESGAASGGAAGGEAANGASAPSGADAQAPGNPDDTQRARIADSVETTLKLGGG